ncbi:hypothetical protein AB0J89_17990 [Micromonospora chokoriensis]
MVEVFRECDPVVDGAAISQGDIFIFHDDSVDGGIWQKAGVIVTADCDIANDKHAGILSYVPILPLHDYLAWRVLPKIAEDRRKRSLQQMMEMVGRLENDSGIPKGLSASAVEVLATVDGGLDDFDRHLRGMTPKDRDALSVTIDEIAICDRVRRSSTYVEQFAALASVLAPTKKKSTEELLLSDIRSRLKTLPGDVFFIGSLAQGHVDGYMAYLRLIRETNLRQISTSYYNKDGRGIVADRVSRLRAPYIYRLTQQMADVFASIGLPEEYETARDSILESSLAPELTLERA